jgi:apolipoprotein N-acyltransferase
MAFASDYWRYGATFLVVVSTGALVWFGTGLHPWWPLLWLAPLPVLLFAGRSPRWSAGFAVASLSWLLGSLNMWHYMRRFLSLPIILAFIVPAALSFGLAVGAFRFFIRRGGLWRASLSMPVIWVVYEFVFYALSPNGTWGNIAYTQMNCLPALQIASLAGVWGISFCVFLAPSSLAALLMLHDEAPYKRVWLAVVIGIFIATLTFGLSRLHGVSESQSVELGLMASDEPKNLFPQSDESALGLYREYAERIPELVRRGAKVIVLPEKVAVVSEQALPELNDVLKQTAAQSKAYILVGLDLRVGAHRHNEARLYSPERELVASYDKQHLLPGFEDIDLPGSSIVTMADPSGIWGIEICKDMDYPRLSRQYGERHVGLLLVPAWDIVDDGWIHGRMAIMRGVENGFAVARAAKEGTLTVSDNRGRVVAEQTSVTRAPFSTLVTGVCTRHASTLYGRFGDWFAWVNIFALVLMFVWPEKHSVVPRSSSANLTFPYWVR